MKVYPKSELNWQILEDLLACIFLLGHFLLKNTKCSHKTHNEF